MTRKLVVVVVVAAAAVLGVAVPVKVGAQSATGAPTTPTYSRDVAPILYRSCTSCHRPGEIGPMSLLSYQEVRPWAKSIAAKVTAGSMPPWHADPSTGEFDND